MTSVTVARAKLNDERGYCSSCVSETIDVANNELYSLLPCVMANAKLILAYDIKRFGESPSKTIINETTGQQ